MSGFGELGYCGGCVVNADTTVNTHEMLGIADILPMQLLIAINDVQKRDPTFDYNDEREINGAKNLAHNLKALATKPVLETDEVLDAIPEAVSDAGYELPSFEAKFSDYVSRQALKYGDGDAQRGLVVVACATCRYSNIFESKEE